MARLVAMNFRKSFKNKKVFLTGHTGFKGAWLSIWLHALGARVKGYALRPENPSLYKMIANRLENHESVIADIRNYNKLEKELLSFRPDYIFHLAAQPLVRESYIQPLETFDVNIMGTAYLLDALRKMKNECHVVVVTTDKVYRNNEKGIPFREDDPLGGHDPYSSSKAAAEIISESYLLSYFHPDNFSLHKKTISTARAGNVIGGGDFAKDRIIPDMVRALNAGKTVTVRNPRSVRPWQHVLEPLSGYLSLAQMKSAGKKVSGAFNFGPLKEDTLTVEELVKVALKTWQKGSYKAAAGKQSLHEAGILRLDNARALKELGWKPKWNAALSISKTVNWYKNATKENAFGQCLQDIEEYIT